jgi:hypothetical protein
MEQLNLLESLTGKHEALERISENAGDWMDTAICEIARMRPMRLYGHFTGEHIRQWVVQAAGEPHHQNAWGALVSRARKENLIEPTGTWQPAELGSSHGRMVPVYRWRKTQ